MRRLWPAYCLLAALVTSGYARYDPYHIDGDGVAYMDIGDLIRSHHWAAVVNGYWNPLYPSLLALGHDLFHATRYTELSAYYIVNFGIFLLEMLAVVVFTDALIQLRDIRESVTQPSAASFLLDRYCLRYLGIALLIVSSQRELSMGKIHPDALLQALLLFAVAALLKHLTTNHLRYAGLMGLALGLGYLTKSFAFVFTLLCIAALVAFQFFWQRHTPTRIATAAFLAIVCFFVVAGPYITALSLQKGRFDFGDSGNLNYAWLVSGTKRMHLEPNAASRYGSAEVSLLHPEDQLLQSPPIFSYKRLPYGTYPDWFDPSYWNDNLKTHMNLHLQIAVIGDCAMRLLRYLTNNPEPWILFAVLLLLGTQLNPQWRASENNFWLAPALLGLSIIGIYGLVHIEDRYITIGIILIVLSLFAMLRLRLSSDKFATPAAASAAVLLLALLPLGESLRQVAELRRTLVKAHSTTGWYDSDIFGAAHALNELGVVPGDTIACIGTTACVYDQYWARLAGVRITTEIYEPTAPLYPSFIAMPNRDQAIEIVRQQGAKAIVGYFATDLTAALIPFGWYQLGQTPFYIFPLNLPDTRPSSTSDMRPLKSN